MRELDTVDVHIRLNEGSIVVPVNRWVLARNMQKFGLALGQAKWEKEAGVKHRQGDLLAVWASVKETFPKFSDLVEHVSQSGAGYQNRTGGSTLGR